MNKTTQPSLTDTSKLLFATLICRVIFVILVILSLPLRPTLPLWMIEWFRRISYPLLAYSIVSLIFHKRAGVILKKNSGILVIDLLISIGIISIGGSWRSSYFGYTFTSIILFTIFKGKWGAYGSALALSAVTVIKDPSGGLPALEVFFVSDWDMRMGGALIYITAGAILGYFHTLLQQLETLSTARIEEARKRTAIEEKTRMALELHDGAKQIVNAMFLKMNPLVKSMHSSQDAIADEFRWLWRAMHFLKIEMNRVMDALKEPEVALAGESPLLPIIEEEAKIAEVMTGFSWSIKAGPGDAAVPLSSQTALRRFLGEAFMNAWKHSGVTSGSVGVRTSDAGAIITIVDAGRGFRYNGEAGLSTTGLNSLRHRSRELNGELIIRSSPEEGCAVILTLPLK